MTPLLLAISLPFVITALVLCMIYFSLRAQRAWAGSTSPLGAAVAVEGLLLQVSNGLSPATFYTIANATDFTLPLSAKTVDVTNVGNNWLAEIPTLLQYGKVSFKVFWIMEEVTHRNSAAGNIRGLRYLMFNKILTEFAFTYPDGNSSTDAFAAYVTEFSISAKVAGVFEASCTLSGNDQNPSFV